MRRHLRASPRQLELVKYYCDSASTLLAWNWLVPALLIPFEIQTHSRIRKKHTQILFSLNHASHRQAGWWHFVQWKQNDHYQSNIWDMDGMNPAWYYSVKLNNDHLLKVWLVLLIWVAAFSAVPSFLEMIMHLCSCYNCMHRSWLHNVSDSCCLPKVNIVYTNILSFHQYLSYWNKIGIIVLSIPSALNVLTFSCLLWFLPNLAYFRASFTLATGLFCRQCRPSARKIICTYKLTWLRLISMSWN